MDPDALPSSSRQAYDRDVDDVFAAPEAPDRRHLVAALGAAVVTTLPRGGRHEGVYFVNRGAV